MADKIVVAIQERCPMKVSIDEIWADIDQWLLANAPSILETLQGGATEAEIEKAEDILRIKLPEDVKTSYRIHNGQSPGNAGLFEGYHQLLSLKEVCDLWNVRMELLRTGDDYWHPLWIPVTQDDVVNHYCLDLDPNLNDKIGCILHTGRDYLPDMGFVISASFQNLLLRFYLELYDGDYSFSEEEGVLIKDEDAYLASLEKIASRHC